MGMAMPAVKSASCNSRCVHFICFRIKSDMAVFMALSSSSASTAASSLGWLLFGTGKNSAILQASVAASLSSGPMSSQSICCQPLSSSVKTYFTAFRDAATRSTGSFFSSVACRLAIPKCQALAICGGHRHSERSARSSAEAVTKRCMSSVIFSGSKERR